MQLMKFSMQYLGLHLPFTRAMLPSLLATQMLSSSAADASAVNSIVIDSTKYESYYTV